MQVFINGQAQELDRALDINALIQSLGIEKRVCAVALNEVVVKKEHWENTQLQENDRLECLQFMGGGWDFVETLLEGAVFIADAHHQEKHSPLPSLLERFLEDPPRQLFLMGDVFQILMGSVKSSCEPHAHILDRLRALSKRSAIFYFEGNHDMGLDYLDSQIDGMIIYPRSVQPVAFIYQQKIYLLAHGDLFLGVGYECYIRLLSSAFSCKFLGWLDRLSKLYPCIATLINAKQIKNLQLSHADFVHFAYRRLELYQAYLARQNFKGTLGGVIEGHFHIGSFLQNVPFYCALPSFYCTHNILRLSHCAFEMGKQETPWVFCWHTPHSFKLAGLKVSTRLAQ